ncbi:FAD:protein FMN transferase [Peloplasma aerotolerans]|uniref:FAD:protein FMN transferase n=1 Tax=Peloplasma aerotolerans TaxID=3044389 RepID=A0AAW6U995_9MOLU|nr:FAD:protein FMN transferase [Mariniplasma sp. M4Ah]MDI6452244.1 FAD:protein FMN transferase [Mariniplasma sp. M4Ah]
MKKIAIITVLILNILFMTACKKADIFTFSFFDYMDTYISVSVYADSQRQADQYMNDISEIYYTYHELSTGYEPLKEDSVFLENIYSINLTLNEVLEIDYELYELLKEAERLKELTDGYFDVSIGKMVDVWKNVILDEATGYLFEEIPESVFESILDTLEAIEVPETPYELTEDDGKYYIEIKSSYVKIDLGALSKGFATQRVYDYLRDEGVEYFSISAGSSSISVGKNMNRETGFFHTSLANPLRTGLNDRTYGMIYVSDISITTSGNYEQYALYEGHRYHHIVSPFTKMPEHYYHTITVLGDDAGALDALSTAFFSMSPSVLEAWLDEHLDDLDIELIIFNYDGTIDTYLKTTEFEER